MRSESCVSESACNSQGERKRKRAGEREENPSWLFRTHMKWKDMLGATTAAAAPIPTIFTSHCNRRADREEEEKKRNKEKKSQQQRSPPACVFSHCIVSFPFLPPLFFFYKRWNVIFNWQKTAKQKYKKERPFPFLASKCCELVSLAGILHCSCSFASQRFSLIYYFLSFSLS